MRRVSPRRIAQLGLAVRVLFGGSISDLDGVPFDQETLASAHSCSCGPRFCRQPWQRVHRVPGRPRRTGIPKGMDIDTEPGVAARAGKPGSSRLQYGKAEGHPFQKEAVGRM